MTRRLISLWLPRFATERRTPDPGGRPVVLVAGEGDRQVVAAVDARAAEAGLSPGLPLAEARAQVPGVVSTPHDPAADARALRRLAAWCGRYSPWTAPDAGADAGGAAGVLLDATGCAHLFGGEAAMLDAIGQRVGALGFTVRVAMAGTVGAAWALARFTRVTPYVCPEGGERDALAPLPPEALRLGASDAGLLHRLGLRTVGDLLALPSAVVAPRAGRDVARRLDQALGRAAEPVNPLESAPPLRVRRAFAEPVGLRGDLDAAMADLAAGLAERLDAAQQGARRLTLTLYRVDGATQTVAVGTNRASRDAAHMTRLLREHLDGLDAGFGVEVVTLAATATEPLTGRQGALIAGPDRGTDALAALLDRLATRLGADAIARPAPRDTHMPERAVTWRAPLARRDGDAPWPRVPPRPVRLFDPAPRLDVPSATPAGLPRTLRWGGLDHRVVAASHLERLSPAWWSAPASGPRDHLHLETDAGRRLWAVRDHGRWSVRGVFG